MVRRRIAGEEITLEATVTEVTIIDGTTTTIITNAALTTIAVLEVVLEDGGGTIAVTDSVTHKAHGNLNLWGVGDISNIHNAKECVYAVRCISVWKLLLIIFFKRIY